ncbi:hypothetical protein D9M71_659530 [compost metagenome]
MGAGQRRNAVRAKQRFRAGAGRVEEGCKFCGQFTAGFDEAAMEGRAQGNLRLETGDPLDP